jgi:hypothetical protein
MKYYYLMFAEAPRFDYRRNYLTTEGNVLKGLRRSASTQSGLQKDEDQHPDHQLGSIDGRPVPPAQAGHWAPPGAKIDVHRRSGR